MALNRAIARTIPFSQPSRPQLVRMIDAVPYFLPVISVDSISFHLYTQKIVSVKTRGQTVGTKHVAFVRVVCTQLLLAGLYH
jgi:hypothetical protein